MELDSDVISYISAGPSDNGKQCRVEESFGKFPESASRWDKLSELTGILLVQRYIL